MRSDAPTSGDGPALAGSGWWGWRARSRAAFAGGVVLALALVMGVDGARAVVFGLGAVVFTCLEGIAARRAFAASRRIQANAADREEARAAEVRLLTLELTHERTRSVLEALHEGVVVVDGGGEVVMTNPAAQVAMRVPEGGVERRLLWEVLPSALGRAAQEAWQVLRENPHAPEAVEPVRRPSIRSGDRIFDLTAVPVRSARTGQDFGYAFLLVDCTRSHELQQLKDRFLSSVSHELRTPLTNICAFSEILGTMLPGESLEWPEFVRVIHEQSVQLSHLVDAMFDYLQLESGEAVLRNVRLDGAQVVAEVVAAAQAAAGRRNIGLTFVGPATPADLVVDPVRLRQLCGHLVDNAVKFAPDGGAARVEVAVDAGSWQLTVDDSGPGVPPQDRRAVFEKFHQLPDHLTDKPSGTGLGLATCAALAHCYRGTIACGDSPLGGARFVVRLPAAAPAAAPSHAAVDA